MAQLKLNSKRTAILAELANCAIRLECWLSKNERCINCTKGSGKKFNVQEYKFQQGKMYAYLYALSLFDLVFFFPLNIKLEDCVPILKEPVELNPGGMKQIWMDKLLYALAIRTLEGQLKEDIIEYRKSYV